MTALSRFGFSTFLACLCCFFLVLILCCFCHAFLLLHTSLVLVFLTASFTVEPSCPPCSHRPGWLSWWESLSTQSRCITNLAINKCLNDSCYFCTHSFWGVGCQNLHFNRTLFNFTSDSMAIAFALLFGHHKGIVIDFLWNHFPSSFPITAVYFGLQGSPHTILLK